MSLAGNLRLTVAAAGIMLVIFVYYLRSDRLDWYDGQWYSQDHQDVNAGYLVKSPGCRIADMDPWDSSIREYLEHTKPVICSAIPHLTFIERRRGVGNVIRIDQNVVSKYKIHASHSLHCCYSVISRISQTVDKYNDKADRKYRVSNCKEFKKEEILSNSTEFVMVECHSVKPRRKDGPEVYKNGHAMVPILPSVAERLDRVARPEGLSVLIIGVDSVSRLNLRRTMPKTLRYLTDNSWVELKAYNKIDDNTFPNLMAILSGQNMSQIGKQCYFNKTRKMDDCPIVWKDFRERGYVTAYAEDTPSIGTFNFLQTGFVEQPTDHYMRPFMLATHDLLTKKTKDSLPVCVGPTAAADHILNYARDFAQTFKDHRYFGLFWTNSLSHNDVNSPGALDIRLAHTLNELSQNGVNNNTVIFLLSDHGMRFGGIRKTFVGYLEERLPFMFIWMPEWFREKHPTRYDNLLTNQNRLTTPYDVYMTVQDVLNPEGSAVSKGCPKCASLFEKVQWDRSCEDAEIKPHWCVCFEFQDIPTTTPIAQQAGLFLYDRIKKRMEELLVKERVREPMCANWTLSRVVSVHQSTNNPRQEQDGPWVSEVFVVIVQLDPGGAVFEATVQVNRTEPQTQPPAMSTLGFISRLDSYMLTTKCVPSRQLKFYCYCLNNKT